MIAYGGLVPAMRLAERCGLEALVSEHVAIAAADGVNAPATVASIVAGMMCGADSIYDLDVLRHGGMDELFDGIRILDARLVPACVHLGQRPLA
ncbi:hypothetical protein AB0J35_60935 [Nonomuraea angiospora]|uniref:hypothetical protein n=1 Tax=Nonomuraea angiospora TaxID=46172 RepID=UPI0034160247